MCENNLQLIMADSDNYQFKIKNLGKDFHRKIEAV